MTTRNVLGWRSLEQRSVDVHICLRLSTTWSHCNIYLQQISCTPRCVQFMKFWQFHIEKNYFRYCTFGNFRENFIFANICHGKKTRLRHDLPILVDEGVIRQFARALFSRNFAYAKSRENEILAKISEFTVLFFLIEITQWSALARQAMKN